MDKQPLDTKRLALVNCKSQMFRTFCLMFIVMLSAATLLGGSFLAKSLEAGVDNLSKRLGADMLVVPYGYQSKIQGALLRGEPSSFYFSNEMTEKIASVEGVQVVSPQLYIATLSAGCCSWPIQMIGFEPKTDFVIQPWLSQSLARPLGDGELVVGYSINSDIGDKLKFFGQTYIVVAKLAKTGMGFDTSAFVNMETARKLVRDSERLKAHPAANDKNLISSMTVKIKDGYTVKTVANNILAQYAIEGVDIVDTKNMISDIAQKLRGLSSYIYIISAIIWLLAMCVLFVIFAVTFNTRKKEFAIYRVLGASRKKLRNIVLCEAFFISAGGTLIGFILAGIVIFSFNTYIGTLMDLPYLRPDFVTIASFTVVSFVFSLLTGPLASVYIAIKLSRTDIYTSLKEGE